MLLYIVRRENAHRRPLDGAGQQYLDQEVLLVQGSFQFGKTVGVGAEGHVEGVVECGILLLCEDAWVAHLSS